MRPSPLSLANLPTTIATFALFVPPVAAAWARRSPREPAGQVALCWGVMGLLGFVSFARYFYFPEALRSFPVHALVLAALPILLLPPSFAWIGRGARRWLWPSIAAWAACAALLVATLGPTRALAAVGDPIMAIVMCTVTGLALGAQTRRAPRDMREHDWFWILTGHLVYFATELFRMPLQESLVARHWNAGLAVHNGIMFVYCASYALITLGMLRRSPAVAPVEGLRPSTRLGVA